MDDFHAGLPQTAPVLKLAQYVLSPDLIAAIATASGQTRVSSKILWCHQIPAKRYFSNTITNVTSNDRSSNTGHHRIVHLGWSNWWSVLKSRLSRFKLLNYSSICSSERNWELQSNLKSFFCVTNCVVLPGPYILLHKQTYSWLVTVVTLANITDEQNTWTFVKRAVQAPWSPSGLQDRSAILCHTQAIVIWKSCQHYYPKVRLIIPVCSVFREVGSGTIT